MKDRSKMRNARLGFVFMTAVLGFGLHLSLLRAQSPVADRAPRLVLIMRHAEKYPDEKNPNLTPTGYARAEKIPSLFVASSSHPPRFPRPDFLFATEASKNSNRPAETIAPLGRALQEKVNLDFDKDNAEPLAKTLLSGKYAGKVVVVVWHHGGIPALAHALGAEAPSKWKDDVFDQIWAIDFNDGSAHLTTAPEMLLPGDSTQ